MHIFHAVIVSIAVFQFSLFAQVKKTNIVQTIHSSSINCLALDPHNSLLFSGGSDKIIKIWDNASGKLISNLKGHKGKINSISVNPFNNTIASGSSDNTIKIWDFQTGKILKEIKEHFETVNGVSFIKKGNNLVSTSYDGKIIIYNTSDYTPERIIFSSSVPLMLAEHPSEEYFATGFANGSVRISNVKGDSILTIPTMEDEISSIAFSPNGDKIAISDLSGNLLVYNFNISGSASFPTLLSYRHAPGAILSTKFHSNGESVFIATVDNKILQIDIKSRKEINQNAVHDYIVSDLATSFDGYLYSAGFDKKINKINENNLKVVYSNSFTFLPVYEIKYHQNTNKLFFTNDESLYCLDLNKKEIQLVTSHIDEISSLEFSPDSSQIISAGVDNFVNYWDVKTLRSTGGFDGFLSPVTSISVDYLTNRIAVGYYDGNIISAEFTNRNNATAYNNFKGYITALKFLKRQPFILVAGNSQSIRMVSTRTGEYESSYTGYEGIITSLAISDDNKIFAAGSTDRNIYLYNIETLFNFATLGGHSEPVTAIEFSNDGKFIFTVADDGAIIKRNLENRKIEFQSVEHSGSIYDLELILNESILITAGADGNIIFSDANTGEFLYKIYIKENLSFLVESAKGEFELSGVSMDNVSVYEGFNKTGGTIKIGDVCKELLQLLNLPR
ncbi:MAG: WD40 repeat domain-containing protein [Ignavibacteriaceae bacterium]|nr:WD40 repeat domain-containing protein [Ignavibacteriaceae bacterium]